MTLSETYHGAVLALLAARAGDPRTPLVDFLGKHRKGIEELSARWSSRQKTEGLPSPAAVLEMLLTADAPAPN